MKGNNEGKGVCCPAACSQNTSMNACVGKATGDDGTVVTCNWVSGADAKCKSADKSAGKCCWDGSDVLDSSTCAGYDNNAAGCPSDGCVFKAGAAKCPGS